MSIDTAALLPPVAALAREAGARIMEIYDTAFQVQEKDDNSPLTAADLASHKTIVAGLQQLTPHVPVLSEESADTPYLERRQWTCFWLVDPLDGTREFIKHNGEFTVNIALIEQREPVLGVVYIPAAGWCYFAARGRGAFRQAANGVEERIHVSPIGAGPVRVVGSRSHAGKSLESYLARLGDHTLVSIGSALKLCLVAEGKADVYPRLGPTSEWDTAAAQCVVEEAGGQVTDLRGARLRYNKESVLNPHFLVFGDAGRDWRAYLAETA